jgi:hypothetical protein
MQYVSPLATHKRRRQPDIEESVVPLVHHTDTVSEILHVLGVADDITTRIVFNKLVRHITEAKSESCIGVQAYTAPPVTAAPVYKCRGCENQDATLFVCDEVSADLICTCCGAVAVDHMLYEGEECRNFSGENDGDQEDRSHCSKPTPYSKYMSDAYQLQTFVKTKNGDALCTRKMLVENDGHQTSVQCKDADKQRAIVEMEDIAEKLGIASLAVMDAVEMFATERNHKERMMHKHLFAGVCLYVCHVNQKKRVVAVAKVLPPPVHCKKTHAKVTKKPYVSPMDDMSLYMSV